MQTLLSKHLSAYCSALAYYGMGISLVLDQSTNSEGNWHKFLVEVVLCKARSQSISQGNQIGYEQMLKLSMNVLNFLMVKLFHSNNAGLKLMPGKVCWGNLQGHIFLKRINLPLAACAFPSYVYFFKKCILILMKQAL